MLTPDYFFGKSDKLIDMYQNLEDWILQDIASRLIEAGSLSGTADRELWKLQQMGLHRQEIVKRISELTGKSRNEVRRLLKESVLTSFSDDKGVLERYMETKAPMQNNLVINAMNAELIKTFGELGNLTRTTIDQSQRDLLNMLNEVDFRVASGMQSYSSAVCEVLDRYANSGVVVNYPTGTSRSLEAAVRCCIVTSMNQTAAQVTNQYIVEAGIEYVLVSAHMGARHDKKHPEGLESHDYWQGKVYKIRGADADAPNLLEATGYDIDPMTGAGHVRNPLGLHGYNCRHSHKPWDRSLRNPYVDENGNPKIDIHESQEMYEKQQQQRAMERSIRQTKRQLLMKEQEMNGFPNSPELQNEYDKLSYTLRLKNRKYGEFCAENDLQKQSDRIKVAGFKREQASKANGRATAYSNQSNLQTKGLSAGESQWEVPKHRKPDFKGKIDATDTTAIERTLNSFEAETLNDKKENACVITKSGEIYRCYGTGNGVFPDADLGDKLMSAIVSHNHPAEYTEYSFSKADFELFNNYKLEMLRGVDVKYKYEFNRNKVEIDEHKNIFDLTEEDTAHEESITRAERARVGYKRWLNE